MDRIWLQTLGIATAKNSPIRGAICASGGISHFVVDEDFDGRMLNAIRDRDTATLFAEPENMFQSGTSETKNWITVAGILSERDIMRAIAASVSACCLASDTSLIVTATPVPERTPLR